MENTVKLAIVIPTYNRKEILQNSLRCIYSQIAGLTEWLSVKIIIVVDGSSDGTAEMLRTEFPEVETVKGTGNWWYTKSMNEGFNYAGKFTPDLVLTLNDDVEPGENYFKNIISDYQKLNQLCILGSVSFSLEKPHRVISSGNRWKSKCLGALKPNIPVLKVMEPSEVSGIIPTETLPGRGMLIPWNILEEQNYFDEKFVQYHSDGDFCLRAKKAGYPVYVSLNSKVFVHLNQTSNSTSFLNNSYRVLIKSFFTNKSRNYLPAKWRFIIRHQGVLISFFIILIFIIVSFRNLLLKKFNK